MIHGVIQHDVYHAGQVGLIKKAIKGMRLAEDDDFGSYNGKSDFDKDTDYF